MAVSPVDARIAEEERLEEARRVRREHRRHQLGVAMVWFGTVLIAFGIGYTQHHHLVGTAALIFVWIEIALLIGGTVVWSNNRHRRDQPHRSDD